MGTKGTRLLSILGAALAALWIGGCASSWEQSRADYVDPVNQRIHRRYPRELAASCPAPFAKVEHCECVIIHATPPDEDGMVRTDCQLRIDGVDRDGVRRTHEERRIIDVRRDASGEWQVVREETVGPPSVVVAREPAFAEESEARGIAYRHRSRGVIDRHGEPQKYYAGSGLGVGDVDGDGHDDVLLVGGGELRLFRNTGDGKGCFVDETKARGLGAPLAGEGRMAVFADYDEDGDQDLFVAVLDTENLLFRNDGKGRFAPVPESASGLRSTGETVGACFADFDSDGDLDLFILNGGNLLRHDPEPMYNAKNAAPKQLYLNRGDGTFEDASERSGIEDCGWSLACTTSDYDKDGDQDLFIANDFGYSCLYRNRGDATFEEVTEEAGLQYRAAAMSCHFGDGDGDGDQDLYIAGMGSNSAWIVDQTSFPVPAPFPIGTLFPKQVLAVFKEMLHGNRYYRNEGDGTFTEVSLATGTARAGWCWSSAFLDYDNDGLLDIYVTNGFISGEDKEDL